MTPRNDMPLTGGPKPQKERGNIGADAIGRIKMLIAAGAVAGTIGGWALASQQNTSVSAQTDVPTVTVAALVQTVTPTATPQAIATMDQTIQTTPTTQATATVTTPIVQASTPTAEPTGTATPQPTATVAQPAATPTPRAFTTTKSSR